MSYGMKQRCYAAAQRTFFAIFVASVANAVALAQLPFQESFESDPGTSYTIEGAFDDGGFDYFGRYLVPDTENGARDDFADGWDGSYGIHSQDNDGEDGPATVNVVVGGIDISSTGLGGTLDLTIALTSTGSFEPLALDNVRVDGDENGLNAIFSLGALASEAGGFDNYEAEDGDGISIFASIDGMSMEIARFSPPAEGTNTMTAAGDLLLDADFDGIGTGVALSATMTDHAFSFSVVPEPNGMLLIVPGLLGLLTIRKRR